MKVDLAFVDAVVLTVVTIVTAYGLLWLFMWLLAHRGLIGRLVQ